MAKKNKTCAVCGEHYSYCYDCNVADPTWKGLFHDENCKTIFETINRLYFNHISEEEARNILHLCDLGVLEKGTANTKIKNIVCKLTAKKSVSLIPAKRSKKTSKAKEENRPLEVLSETLETEE